MEPLKEEHGCYHWENTFSCIEQGFSIPGHPIRRSMTTMRSFRRNPQTCLEAGVPFWYHTGQPHSRSRLTNGNVQRGKEMWVPLKSVTEGYTYMPSLLTVRINSWWRLRVNGLCQHPDTEEYTQQQLRPTPVHWKQNVFVCGDRCRP